MTEYVRCKVRRCLQGILCLLLVLGVFWTSAASAEADEAQEEFTFTVDVTALSSGVHQVQAYSVDGAGNVETSPAGDIISIQAPSQNVFLPLLMDSQ